jgi:hypothetical protein
MTDMRPAEVISADPKGLIRESYVIDGITLDECRSILIDWALSLPLSADTMAATQRLLDHYGAGQGNHPMTQLLTLALTQASTPTRRGGRAGRIETI